MRSSIAVLVIWVLAAPFASAMEPSAVKEYVIKLDRAEKVGDQLELSASGTIQESNKVSVAGTVVKETSQAIEFKVQGVYETLAVDDKGLGTKRSFTVAKMVKIEDGREVELLAPGKVVIAETKGLKTDLQLKDTTDKFPEEAKKVLDASDLLATAKDELAGNDDIYGSTLPRKVGDSWDMNTELSARNLAKILEGVKKEHLKGKIQLVGVTKVNGTECLEIQMTTTLSPFPLLRGMPPGSKVVKGKLTFSGRILLPVDLTLPSLGGETSVDFHFVAAIPGAEPGKEMRVESSKKVKVKTSVTPKVNKKEE